MKEKKEPLLSSESRIVLKVAILITVFIEVAMFLIIPLNWVRVVTTSITLLYAIIWILSDIKHGIHDGSEYNKKSILFDFAILIMELIEIAIWVACDIFLDISPVVTSVIFVVALVGTVLIAILKS